MHKLRCLIGQTNRRVVDDDQFCAAVSDRLTHLFRRKCLLFVGFAADQQESFWHNEFLSVCKAERSNYQKTVPDRKHPKPRNYLI